MWWCCGLFICSRKGGERSKPIEKGNARSKPIEKGNARSKPIEKAGGCGQEVVETVLELKAAVTQNIAAELELKNMFESTVMLKLRAPGFVSVHVAICDTAAITKEATVSWRAYC